MKLLNYCTINAYRTLLFKKGSLLALTSINTILSQHFKAQLICEHLGDYEERCRLSWLTNSALVCEPKCGGG
jgi:hypothetical protein